MLLDRGRDKIIHGAFLVGFASVVAVQHLQTITQIKRILEERHLGCAVRTIRPQEIMTHAARGFLHDDDAALAVFVKSFLFVLQVFSAHAALDDGRLKPRFTKRLHQHVAGRFILVHDDGLTITVGYLQTGVYLRQLARVLHPFELVVLTSQTRRQLLQFVHLRQH